MLSREQTIDAVKKAGSVEEVYEITNAAMVDRKSWPGEKFEFSRMAAEQWRRFSFIIEAADSGAILGNATYPKVAVKAASLESAKAASTALLGKMESLRDFESADAANKAVETFNNELAQRTGTPSKITFEAIGSEALRMRAVERSSEQHKNWSDIERALSGESANKFIRENSRSPTEEFARRSQWDAASKSSAGVKGLVGELGLSFIQAGPSGGSEQIYKGANILNDSFKEISRKTSFHGSAVTLDFRGAELNRVSEKSLASYIPSRRTLSFGPAPRSLTHEWTHGLQHAIYSSGDLAQKKALDDLLTATRTMPAANDPEFCKLWKRGPRRSPPESVLSAPCLLLRAAACLCMRPEKRNSSTNRKKLGFCMTAPKLREREPPAAY